ncbi:MAG: T9SS type A sorting domain-containing protein [Vicingaceae bacterium]|nr:T9SS type A sorting domain-containing protein [Vicingaceae bacterium]
MVRFIVFFVIYFQFSIINATCVSVSSGDWANPSTWLCNGIPCVPFCGDTIIIQAGHTVTITSQQDYSNPGCTIPMFIVVKGTLDFPTNGPKLRLPCNSSFFVNNGGTLSSTSSAGGGSSNFLEICGTVVWRKADGTQTGPTNFGAAPLPITLVSFDAIVKDNTIQLTWITSSEINNDFFTIERSTDAQHWEEILTTKGAGNSNQFLTYLETDFNPLEGISYYRLKQTDFDGQFEYFNIVPVRFTKNHTLDFSLFPNPVRQNETLNMITSFTTDEEILVVVRDLQGKEFYTKAFITIENQEFIGVPIDASIPVGIYIIVATSENSIYSKKLIVK